MATKEKKKQRDDDEEKPLEVKITERVEKFSQTLKCPLSKDEVETRADRCANLVAIIEGMEADMKAAQKHAKAEIETRTAELAQLSNEIRTRATYRMTECERRYDYETGIIVENRLDCGDLLNKRKMTESERQLELFPNDGTPVDESWKSVPIGDALNGLPKAAYDAFEQRQIVTVGDFSDYMAKKGDFWQQDLPGVGPETATKISDAFEEFWAQRKAQ